MYVDDPRRRQREGIGEKRRPSRRGAIAPVHSLRWRDGARSLRASCSCPSCSLRRRHPRVLHVPDDAPDRAAPPAVGPRGDARPRQREGRSPRQAHHRAGQRRRRDRRSSAPRRSSRERWLPTAQRETPTVRAVLVLDEAHDVARLRVARGRRVRRGRGVPPAPRPAHAAATWTSASSRPTSSATCTASTRGQSYLVSYWQRVWRGPALPRRRVARRRAHRAGRDARALLGGRARPSRVNVVDEDGRIIFGPPLRSGEFTVGVRFPTTLYNWRLQVSPSASDELAARVREPATARDRDGRALVRRHRRSASRPSSSRRRRSGASRPSRASSSPT